MAQAPKGRAVIEMLLDTNQLTKSLKRVEDNFKRVGANILKIGAGFTGFGAGLIGSLLVAANEAGDAAEVFSRFEAVFKGASKEVRAFASEVAKSIGRTEKDVLDALSSYQSFFIGLGKGDDEAKELSKTLTTLALDFASFNNLTDEDAQGRFLAGLSGSSEVFDKYGINIKAAALDQELLNQGLGKTTATATENEKVMARLAIIMEALGKQGAIGDATRTADSYNNVLKRLQASFTDLKQAIGDAVLKDISAFNAKLSQSINKIKEFIAENPGLIRSALQIGAGLVAAGVAISSIGVAFIGAGFAVSGLSSAIGILSSTVILLTSSFAGLGVAIFAGLISPLGIATLSVTAILAITNDLTVAVTDLATSAKNDLGGAFDDAKNNFNLLKQAILAGEIELAFKILASSIKLFFLDAFKSITNSFAEWVALTNSSLNNIAVSFQQTFLFIKQLWTRLRLVFSEVSDALAGAFLSVLPKIENLFIGIVTKIKLLWVDIKGLIEGGIKFTKGDISGAKQTFTDLLAEREKIQKEADKEIKSNLSLSFGKIESDLTKQLKSDIDGITKEIDRLEKGALDFTLAAFSVADDSKAETDQAIKDAKQEIKFLGLVAKQTAQKQLLANEEKKKEDKEAAKVFKSLIPKFGQLAETGSSGALKLFGNTNPLVKEQQQANKTLAQIALNTSKIEVR